MSMHHFILNFTSPLHIGLGNGELDQAQAWIHSDVLYSAIYSTWAKCGMESLIPKGGVPDFVLSSAFPYAYSKSQKRNVYFFPRPLWSKRKNTELSEKDSLRIKQIKKVAWMDADLWIEQWESSGNDFPNFIQGAFASSVLNDQDDLPFSSQVDVRVQTAKEEGDPKPFYVERFFFSDKSGLHFIVSTENETSLKALRFALDILSTSGIGTDKSTGNGQFVWEEKSFDLFPITSSRLGVALSCYLPESPESISGFSGFQLLRRGGWIGASRPGWRKKHVHMIQEGSVLAFKEPFHWGQGLGTTVDLRPKDFPHPIYRCGLALFFPIPDAV